MDLRKIKTLIGLFEESSLSELEMSAEGEQIRIVRGAPATTATASVAAPIAEVAAMPINTASAIQEKSQSADDVDLGGALKSPLVGTFYRKPSPDEPPFVEVGQSVKEGDVLCIIEAMKTMNPVKAKKPGVVSKILVSDNSPVEYGQPLIIIE